MRSKRQFPTFLTLPTFQPRQPYLPYLPCLRYHPRMNWSAVLVDGLLLSAAASAIIFASLSTNPRIWLNDFPADIRRAIPPKTEAEKRLSLMWGVPLMVILLGGPGLSTWRYAQAQPDATFAQHALHAAAVAFVFNVVDLLVIDWLVLCTWTPRRLVIPGTEGMAGYTDYGHHFRGFIAGTIFSVVLGAIVAVVVRLT